MAAMEKRIIVSGGDEVRVFAPPGRGVLEHIRLEGAGTLCACGEHVFCASNWGDMVWRLDAQKLVPTGLFAGGPDMRNMLISPDGERLMILCAEADSVLLLDAVCGAPMVLARAGVNPQHMSLDESGEVLAVAAGESGEVLLLSARSLALLRRLPMPGIVLDVALCAGTVYALCLNETLNSTLVTIPRAGARQILSLSGMPGRIACERGDVICATEGFLHTVSMDGMRLLGTRRVSGRASIWLTAGETLLLCDALSECIFARNGGGQWSLFCEHARDMRFLFGKG